LRWGLANFLIELASSHGLSELCLPSSCDCRHKPPCPTPNSFYGVRFTLIPKLAKVSQENYKPISFMNMDANIPANKIQKHVKRIIYSDNMGFI
jgi:hypothetical protein